MGISLGRGLCGKIEYREFVSRLVASVERLSPTVFVLCFCGAGKRLRTAVLLYFEIALYSFRLADLTVF